MVTAIARLQALDIWPEIRERLLAGELAMQLVYVVQGERGVLLDLVPERLLKALVRYRENEVGVLPPAALQPAADARQRYFMESSRLRNSLGRHVERVGGELGALRAIMAARLARGEIAVVDYCQIAELDRRWTETRARVRKLVPVSTVEGDTPERIAPEAVLEDRRRLATSLRGAARRLLLELRTIDVTKPDEEAAT